MKKIYTCLLYTGIFFSVFVQLEAQNIIKKTPTSKNSKLQLGLAEVVAVKQSSGILTENNVPLFSLQNFKENNTKIRVDILSEGHGDALYSELTNLEIEIVARQQNYFTCWVEISQIENYLNKAPSIAFMRSSLKPLNNAGPIHSQGDSAQRSDLARALGVNGAGVKVGVLSDSYNHLGGAPAGVTSGELPGTTNPNGFTTPIKVLAEMNNTGGSDEGRAMLEIIHDVAPAAQLYYYTAFNGQPDFANGIRALADSGCNVIVDDVFYYAEPMFQDGIIAQAVDYAVNEKGATFFSSAGNYANNGYDAPYQASTFEPVGAGKGTAHNFGTVADPIYYLPIAKTNLGEVRVTLNWDEPSLSAGNGSPGSASDLDLFLLSYDGTNYTILQSSTTDNLGTDPFEFATVSGNRDYYVAIVKFSGPDPTRLRLINYGGINWNTSTPDSIVGIKAGTVSGHSNASQAIATAAAHYVKTPAFGVDPPELESFSSKGGSKIFFTKEGVRLASPEDRLKPELTAPDGANNSFFGHDSEPDGSPNFFGTSAAAPHAAAVAALMLEADSLLTPDLIRTELVNSSTDMDDPTTLGFDTGFDYSTGAGLIKADVAVQTAINNTQCRIDPTSVYVNFRDICLGSSVTLYASCTSGTITWYNSAFSLVSIGTGTGFLQTPTSNTTYYASCDNETCESGRVATGLVTVVPVQPVSLTLVSNIYDDTIKYSASQSINAANKILSPAKITYEAGNSILLDEGFEAQDSSLFLAQIKNCQYTPTSGLLAYYPFNGNANDETGNGNDGVVYGATLTADRFGNPDNAYAFDGINDKISSSVGSTFYSEHKTISFWAKISGAGIDNPRMVGVGPANSPYQYYSVILEGTSSPRRIWFFTSNSLEQSYSATSVADNSGWHNYQVTFDGHKVKVYIDGVLDKETNTTGSLANFSNAVLQIGSSDNGLDPFNGALDDLCIYNRALSDAEVTAIYNAEKP